MSRSRARRSTIAGRAQTSGGQIGSKTSGRYTPPKPRGAIPSGSGGVSITKSATPVAEAGQTGPMSAAAVRTGPSRDDARVVPPDRLDAFLQRVAPEILVVTYWFDPPPMRSATIRFSGKRDGVTGSAPGDRFVHDEIVEPILPGCGPIALSARIYDVNPGDWETTAELVAAPAVGGCGGRRDRRGDSRTCSVYPAAWSWRRWRLSPAPSGHVHTCLAPYARVPGTVVGSWLALAALGIIVALVTQALVISGTQARLHHARSISLLALAAGIIAAKGWFVVVNRRAKRREGWCIQGLVAGVTIVSVVLLLAWRTPVGVFFDVTVPGLMFGLAVGRLGCFFTGCCVGRPTASRWGVWSSDRRVGVRRVPTQLLESTLAVSLGAVALIIVTTAGHLNGGLFISVIATYTLVRQLLLRRRASQRTSRFGGALIAATAAAGLIVGVAIAVAR